ncbi:Xaa-Pro peptidase family protein [Aquibacillus sp. 3ASR75-11]|uniref:Xaa-Pro peptidase family protein n=1 Tax=Terrihalobacillus insolitus TaxID=2950438 RepID=A0A9X3WV92_9BACI|nr:Xaa-Pro peptidase family protein [Terrihalobacillus insolitus]MDC3425458.1 Xaa-Pro peptidase family protein [Terrihalobacillus insolitus]
MELNTYDQRLNKLKNFIEEKEVDLLMITSPVNIFYFTGFYSDPHERFMALVLERNKNQPYLFVPLLDFEAAESHSYVREILTVSDSQDPYQVLESKVGRKPTSFGVEKKNMSLYQYERLNQWSPVRDWIDIEGFITSQRISKTPEEITKIKKAIDMIEEVMEAGRKKVQVGMLEIDLLAELEYQMRRVGSDGPSFSTIVLTGKNSSLPHGQPVTTPIENNDFLLIDMGVKTEGYCSDITRTFIVGEASAKQEQMYNTVLESNQKAIESVKINQPLSKVDIAAREWIKRAGYGDYFNNRVGHGMGMEVHEEPSVHEKNADLIKLGMVFTIEPGIYIPNFGGVRIEDDVYVNEKGEVEVLTTYPKKLISVG